MGDRTGGDTVTSEPMTMRLAIIEAQHLVALIDEFVALLDSPRDAQDAGVQRLNPNPYPDSPDDAEQFLRSTRDELTERRVAAALEVRTDLEAFLQTAPANGRGSLDEYAVKLADERVDAWMRTLSAIRLVLAARLGIEQQDAHDPEDVRFGAYDWLGYRLEVLVQLADEHERG
ncbi:DUF2017 family protein [Microbacterium sp. NPDC058342]|uniref:DUF2017 family protein n=1 Tax=Microbacterium sp. NPDC058342 TaxID=3346454 RepID=UPI0036604933